MTTPQILLLEYMNSNSAYTWVGEVCIPTRKKPPYPTYYGVDIACLALGICIEVDGPSHRHPAVHVADNRKTRFLRKQGYMVLRVTNDEILHDVEGLFRRYLRAQIKRRLNSNENG